MKVAVAHGPGNNVQELRKILHGAGAQCTSEDCVLWEDLAVRLGQSDVDLIVVQTDESVNWASITEAKSFSAAPLIAVGPNGETEAAARQAGVTEYVTSDRIQPGLDETLHRLLGGGSIRCQRGLICSVFTPTPGNGGTFVSLNLADQLAQLGKKNGALIDVSVSYSKIGLTLGIEQEHSFSEVCARLHRLDRLSLLSFFNKCPSGLQLLYGDPNQPNGASIKSDSVRRLMVLSRMSASSTVFQTGSQLQQPQVDVLRMSDRIVLVVRPDLPSINRASRTLEQLSELGIAENRIALIVNLWGESGGVSKQHVEEAFNRKDAVYLPYDPGRANRCTNEGLLLSQRYPRSRVARQLAKFAKGLMDDVMTSHQT